MYGTLCLCMKNQSFFTLSLSLLTDPPHPNQLYPAAGDGLPPLPASCPASYPSISLGTSISSNLLPEAFEFWRSRRRTSESEDPPGNPNAGDALGTRTSGVNMAESASARLFPSLRLSPDPVRDSDVVFNSVRRSCPKFVAPAAVWRSNAPPTAIIPGPYELHKDEMSCAGPDAGSCRVGGALASISLERVASLGRPEASETESHKARNRAWKNA